MSHQIMNGIKVDLLEFEDDETLMYMTQLFGSSFDGNLHSLQLYVAFNSDCYDRDRMIVHHQICPCPDDDEA